MYNKTRILVEILIHTFVVKVINCICMYFDGNPMCQFREINTPHIRYGSTYTTPTTPTTKHITYHNTSYKYCFAVFVVVYWHIVIHYPPLHKLYSHTTLNSPHYTIPPQTLHIHTTKHFVLFYWLYFHLSSHTPTYTFSPPHAIQIKHNFLPSPVPPSHEECNRVILRV